MFILFICAFTATVLSGNKNVTYDSRSLIIDGERLLLLSGGMHYSRGTPTTWNHVMKLAKQMHLNTIQTYFMWNLHEPLRKGELIWSGSANITQFMDLAMAHDLYVVLRIGPYICGEWNYGGFPWWTRNIPNIQFRTYNQPFMTEMQRILQIVIDKVTPYLASNGGPIIMLQVENEYKYYPNSAAGKQYVEWAVQTAVNMTKPNPVPWIMCEHNPTMNTSAAVQTINGFWDEHNIHGTGWPSPLWISEHKQAFPDQPLWWTEDQAWFQEWGGGTIVRPVNQIANGILRWVALGGSYHNLYMMYGGNNFGRYSGYKVTTAYANDAVINAFGIANNPKYDQLSKVFATLSLYSKCILSMDPPKANIIQTNIEAITYRNSTVSITFLSNIGAIFQADVAYMGQSYDIAANSTLLLDRNGHVLVNSTGNGLDIERYPDCIPPTSNASGTIEISLNWLYYSETAGIGGKLNTTHNVSPVEMWNITSDTTEYIWYIPTGLEPFAAGIEYTLQFPNADGGQYAYIMDRSNDQLLTMGALGSKISFKSNYSVPDDVYDICILVASFGMYNGGNGQQTLTKGIVGSVLLNGREINSTGWISEGGLYGEYLELYDKMSFNKVAWKNEINSGLSRKLTWWRSSFVTPHTMDTETFTSLAVDMVGAIKGFIYVNGYNLGRYWMIPSMCNGQPHGDPDVTMQWDQTYCSRKLPLQRYYSLPTDWLNPSGQTNDIVIIEEVGMANVEEIKLVYCQVTSQYKS
eukprot:201907_1